MSKTVIERLPDEVKFNTEDDIPDEALASDEAYEAAIAAINKRNEEGGDPPPSGEEDDPPADPPAGSEPAKKDDDPPPPPAPANTPPATPPAPEVKATADELAFFERYDVKVDKESGLIEGKYKTAAEFFAANKHLRTFVGKRTADVLREDPAILREYLQNNPDFAKDLLSQINITPQYTPPPPTPPQAGGGPAIPPSGYPQDTPPPAGSEAPLTPQAAVETWVNQMRNPALILQSVFADRLRARGIEEFPQNEQEWEDFADANPSLAQDIKLHAMVIEQERRQLREYGMQLVGQHFETRKGVEAHNKQVYENDLKSLNDTFGYNDTSKIDDFVIELFEKPELQSDPRYFEEHLGVVRLRPGAIRAYIVDNNAELITKSIQEEAKRAAAAEANEYFKTRSAQRGTPLPTGITSKLGSTAVERNGQHVQLPTPEEWKNPTWMSLQENDDLDVIEEMIDKLPPADRARYY